MINPQYTAFNLKTIEDAITSILDVVEPRPVEEHDLREGLKDTPKRVAKMYHKILGGYNEDPQEILGKALFTENYDELISVTNIPFYSLCEHHMVPFYGHAHVGYIPNGKVVGLSKIPRVVNCFARRLQVQERLTLEIADSLEQHISARGVIVVIQAEHLCMAMRGVEKPGCITTTSIVRGLLRERPEAREEFFSIVRTAK